MTTTFERQWNTWDGAHPAAMIHLPTGLAARLTAYSAKEGKYFELLPGPEVSLHEHSIDGDFVRLVAKIAGSDIELIFAKQNEFSVSGKVRVLHTGEWGLRFWITLEVGFTNVLNGPRHVPEDRQTIQFREPPRGAEYTEAPVIVARHRSTWCAVTTSQRPIFHGLYDDPSTLCKELEEQGYYAPHKDADEATWATLRFNGQANDEWNFSASLGNDEASAIERAKAELTVADQTIAHREAELMDDDEARAAVRDVISWNTIWDIENARPITVLTRNWLSGKFGGWGVWLDDILFNALLAAACGDWETSRANLDAALTTVAPAGNLPCLRTAFEEWVDRSQPPIATYVVWRIYELTGDDSLFEKWLPTLVRAHDWWFEHRDGNGDELLEFGSSPTGTGAFVHSKQAAMDEAAMDNLPAFDEAEFDPIKHTLDLAEPGLNSLVSLEGQLLSRIAQQLGKPELAARLAERAERLNANIQVELWDDDRGVFAGRKWNGDFVRSLAPTSFYPLVAGAATEEQTSRLISEHLRSENEFWGERVIPASTFDDPASEDNVYWRGRIWAPLVFWTWEGLRRAGRHEDAREVADKSWSMFAEDWRVSRACRENYHRNDRSGDDSVDSDPFYSWGALIPLMKVLDSADKSPWVGRLFSPVVGTPSMIQEPSNLWSATREVDGSIRVLKNKHTIVIASNVEQVVVDDSGSTLFLSTIGVGEQGRVETPGLPWENVLAYAVNGTHNVVPPTPEGNFSVDVPAGESTKIVIWHRIPLPHEDPTRAPC